MTRNLTNTQRPTLPIEVERSGSNIHRMAPAAVKRTAGRLSTFYQSLRDDPSTSHHVERASGWYPEANALAQEISPGDTPRGAGVISALSPSTEWETNKRMATQIGGYHPDMFDIGEEAKREATVAADMRGSTPRSVEAAGRVAKHEVYKGYGVPDLSQQSRQNLDKAHRIYTGEEPPLTGPITGPKKEMGGALGHGPKTRSFYGNILDPEDPKPVTIDTHAHDAAVGHKYPYAEPRGLSSIGRYESFATAYRGAAAQHGVVPNEMQAAVWSGWKDLKGDWSDTDRLERMDH